MDAPSPLMRDIARRLLAVEAASGAPDHAQEATRVCERLRVSLMRFAGPDGFAVLLRRALALARAEFPSLETIKIDGDCRLEVIDDAAGNLSSEAAAAIAAHLLGLLATFIGEPLTLRMVREAWPDEPFKVN